MKYIKRFETNADYQAFKSSDDYLTPNLCAIEDIDDVVYQKLILPTFTIYNTNLGQTYTYSFVDGMTWSEFIESEYNTDNMFFVYDYSNDRKYVAHDKSSATSKGIEDMIEPSITISNKIIANKHYVTKGGIHGGGSN